MQRCLVRTLRITKPNGERFVFTWTDADESLLVEALAKFASDPDLSLTWTDVGHAMAYLAAHLPETADQPGV